MSGFTAGQSAEIDARIREMIATVIGEGQYTRRWDAISASRQTPRPFVVGISAPDLSPVASAHRQRTGRDARRVALCVAAAALGLAVGRTLSRGAR